MDIASLLAAPSSATKPLSSETQYEDVSDKKVALGGHIAQSKTAQASGRKMSETNRRLLPKTRPSTDSGRIYKKSHISRKQEETLSDRLDRLERSIHDSFILSRPDKIESPSSASRFVRMNSFSETLPPDRAYLHNGFPFLASECQNWVSSRVSKEGLPSSIANMAPFYRTSKYDEFPDPVQTQRNSLRHITLPPATAVKRRLKSYLSSSLCLAFPIVNMAFLEACVVDAYSNKEEETQCEKRAKICVMAFLCFHSLFEYPRTTDDCIVVSENIASVVRGMIPIVCQDMCLESLQICTFMSVYYFFIGDLHEASIVNTLSVRINAFISPVQHVLSQATNERNENIRRNLFWVTYIIDKELCLQTGHISLINDDHYDLSLSYEYLKSFLMNESDLVMEYVLSHSTLLLYDIRLAFIKSEIYDGLFSARARTKSDLAISTDIKHLIDMLEQWRASLPPNARPRSHIHRNATIPGNPGMRLIMMQLAYFDCISITYTANCRCRAPTTSQSIRTEQAGPNLTLAVEASRSSLKYLVAVQSFLSAKYFWLILIFPLRALSIILFSSLLYPRSLHIVEDKEVMTEAINIIRVFIRGNRHSSCVLRMKDLDTYMENLERVVGFAL